MPFQIWTPDVYQGAPAPVTAFLSTGSKVALFAALLRFSYYAGNDIWAYMVPVLWILAVLTMAVGNVSALSQYQAKRLLAFLQWFEPIDEDFIPDNSLLREFICGSILQGFTLWENGFHHVE